MMTVGSRGYDTGCLGFFLIFYKSDDSMIHYVHYAKMVMIQDGHDRNRKWVCFKQNGDDTQDGCNK